MDRPDHFGGRFCGAGPHHPQRKALLPFHWQAGEETAFQEEKERRPHYCGNLSTFLL